MTQGSLVRFLLRAGRSATDAKAVAIALNDSARHEFWPADVSFAEVSVEGVIGHRQVTDAYLAQLARSRGGSLVTLDSGLAQLHSDVALLIAV